MAKAKRIWRDGERKTLVLSQSYEVVNFTNEVRAVLMSLKGRAEVLATWDSVVPTSSTAIPVPSVLRLKHEFHRRNGPVRYHRVVVFRRDGWVCQYCAKQLTRREATIDHVNPQCKGGLTTYKNCVTSCRACNHAKAFRTPAEAGMRLLSTPSMPSIIHLYNIDTDSGWHPEWDNYIGHLK